MARKVVNRKALREEADAAEAAEKAAGGATKAPKKAAPKRKSRAKEPAEIRMKLFWGVYNQAMKLVAKYDYTQKKAADQKAEALSASGKTPHFVAKVKEAVEG
jgi:hypothetical protein